MAIEQGILQFIQKAETYLNEKWTTHTTRNNSNELTKEKYMMSQRSGQVMQNIVSYKSSDLGPIPLCHWNVGFKFSLLSSSLLPSLPTTHLNFLFKQREVNKKSYGNQTFIIGTGHTLHDPILMESGV